MSFGVNSKKLLLEVLNVLFSILGCQNGRGTAQIALSVVWARTYDHKFFLFCLYNPLGFVYNTPMKDNYSTLNLTLPIFLLVGFMSICGLSALLLLIEHFCLGGI